MIKCIVCECANIIRYNPPKERPPMKCPHCGRDTRNYITLKADDQRVDKLVEKYRKRNGGNHAGSGMEEKTDNIIKDRTAEADDGYLEYRLVNEVRGCFISIPQKGGVVGRTALGGEELAHNQRISREHIKIVPAKRAEGLLVEDISANGTFVNGRRLDKNKSEFAVIGSSITMGGETFIIKR